MHDRQYPCTAVHGGTGVASQGAWEGGTQGAREGPLGCHMASEPGYLSFEPSYLVNSAEKYPDSAEKYQNQGPIDRSAGPD